MKKILLIYLISCIITPVAVFAQNKVQGRITDSKTHEGLTGVSVVFPKTGQGVSSDINGHFSIESAEKIDTLVFSFIGYQVLKMFVSNALLDVRMEQTTIELNQFVISAQRENQNRKDAPMALTVLPIKIIDETKASEISDLLNKVSGVHIANFGNENQSASIRQPLNFTRAQLVILEDEVQIIPTTIATSQDLKEINMSVVKSVEVLKGPASSIYGSEAIGGTINFITKNPSLYPTAGISIQANNMGYKRLDFEAANTFKKFGVFIGGYSAYSKDGYRDYSDFDKTAVLLKTVYRFNPTAKLTTSVTFIKHNTNVSGSLDSAIFFTNDKYNQYAFCYADNQTIRANTRLDKNWNERNNTFFILHLRGNREDQIPTYYIKRAGSKYLGEYEETQYISYGMLAQHKIKFNFMNARLIAGISFDVTPYNLISKVINVTKTGALYSSYSITDSFVQDFHTLLVNTAEYFLFEFNPVKKLKVSAALRYDRLDYTYDNHLPPTSTSGAPDDKNNFDHLSPKIGLNYNVNNYIGFYGSYSVGFAPPLFSQLYKEVVIPVLKPASFTNYEVGGWYSFMKNKGFIDVSLYYSLGKNEIVAVLMPDNSTQNQSTGETSHQGLEYSLRYKFFDQLEFRFSSANSLHKFIVFVNQDDDYSGKIMNLAPGWTANSEITYRPEFLPNFRIAIEWQKIGKYYIDELNTREYPGYQIFNLRTGYTFKGFEVWVNLMNITDELFAVRVTKSSYSGAISYMPGIRRTIFVGIGYNFDSKKIKEFAVK